MAVTELRDMTPQQLQALEALKRTNPKVYQNFMAIASVPAGPERDRVATDLGFDARGDGTYNKGPGVKSILGMQALALGGGLLAGGALAGGGAAAAGGGAAGAGAGGTAAGGAGALGAVGNFARNNWRDIATVGGAAYSGIQGARNQGRSNELAEQALELARRDYEDRGPLREAFTRGAMTPIASAPNLSSIFEATNSTNPFATGGSLSRLHVPSQLNFGPVSGPTGGGGGVGATQPKGAKGGPTGMGPVPMPPPTSGGMTLDALKPKLEPVVPPAIRRTMRRLPMETV